jgi:hypothetical protein
LSDSAFEYSELCFLADESGSLIGYQETGASWTSLLAFSSEQKALQFRRDSGLSKCAVLALDLSDTSNLQALIAQVKRRAVRSLLLDLDFHSGRCSEVGFIGKSLTAPIDRQLTPRTANLSVTRN